MSNNSNHFAKERELFLADYQHMREFGLTNKKIAERFGVQLDSLQRRLKGYGEYLPDFGERRVAAALERVITSGRTFTVDGLPSEDCAPAIVQRELRAGRICKVGSKRGPGGKVSLYQATGAAEASAQLVAA